MNSPICVTNICVTNRKRTASFSIAGLMLAIVPLWLMLAAANTSAQTSTTPSPADWTQFHRDNMQRWNPYETMIGTSNVWTLQVKWSFPINYDPDAPLASPVLANGVVYVASSAGLPGIHALNASTGAQLWNFAALDSMGLFDPVYSSPAVTNGVVYFGTWLGIVYAVNASTGTQMWSYAATGDTIFSSPAVVNGVVYVNGFNGTTYALNASTGAKLWSYYACFCQGNSSPAVANGVVYFGVYDYTSMGGIVYALNASSGALLWSYPTGDAVESSPAVANGVVYFGSFDHNVYALNASTGALQWSYPTGGQVFSSPAVANGVVYIGSKDDNVYALNASTGDKLWSYATGGQVHSSPAVANGVVYVGSDDDSVYALNADTGARLWSYATGGVVFSSPIVVDGVVYGNSFGTVYAFGLGGTADLYMRIEPSPTPVGQGELLTYAFPVWNLGPDDADQEVLTTQVPLGTTFDYIRISGTPGLGTCTHPPYQGTGQIVCHENSVMAPNTTWTVRLTVKVTAPAGTAITANAATIADTPDPNLANNTATVSIKVQ
jgi:outer membrane protein assembly factor BamB